MRVVAIQMERSVWGHLKDRVARLGHWLDMRGSIIKGLFSEFWLWPQLKARWCHQICRDTSVNWGQVKPEVTEDTVRQIQRSQK